MTDLKTRLKKKIKELGDQAPEYFGVSRGTLDRYLRTGMYPLKFIDKIERSSPPVEVPSNLEPSQPESVFPMGGPLPQPVTPETLGMTEAGAHAVIDQNKAMEGVYRAFEAISQTDKRVEEIVKYIQGTVDVHLRQFHGRISTLERGQAGTPSFVRPAQNAPVDQTYTTRPDVPGGAPLDSGIGPSKDAVDAQANKPVIEGVPVPGAELARPAVSDPNAHPYGFGWNTPRPRK